ncbi:hypothetical protein ACUTQ5_09735 [Serratia sp. NA_112.1]|uniref:hypothetical protein n=1 Tax=unclassified Serratia (in: enterobacteria) TaxID=2647522 RepID=UPI004046986F
MLVITIITSTVCFTGVSAKSLDFHFGMRQARGTVSTPGAAGQKWNHFILMNLLHILYHHCACPLARTLYRAVLFLSIQTFIENTYFCILSFLKMRLSTIRRISRHSTHPTEPTEAATSD